MSLSSSVAHSHGNPLSSIGMADWRKDATIVEAVFLSMPRAGTALEKQPQVQIVAGLGPGPGLCICRRLITPHFCFSGTKWAEKCPLDEASQGLPLRAIFLDSRWLH